MADLTLDRKDRLILANQYRILKKIDPDEGDFYQRSLEILENGYEREYERLTTGIYEDTMSAEECEEVHLILGMFRRLSYSYKELGDKSGIEADDLRFHGFDGNNEDKYLSYGTFLNSLGKYEESEVIDSHMPSLEMYRRMLAEFEPLKEKPLLGKEDIQRVLAAQIHPSNRK
jgi:hypothetical protein